jgi:hypothetical protein
MARMILAKREEKIRSQNGGSSDPDLDAAIIAAGGETAKCGWLCPDAAYVSLAGSARALFQKEHVDRLSIGLRYSGPSQPAAGSPSPPVDQCGRTFSVSEPKHRVT